MTHRRILIGVLAGAALLVAACSPEADRHRGAGAGSGADVGNWPEHNPSAVDIHGTTNPAFDVPDVGKANTK